MWYELRLSPNDNDTLMVTAPAFPEVNSFSYNVEYALRYGLLAVEEAMAARRANGKEVPAPVRERQEGTYYVGSLDV